MLYNFFDFLMLHNNAVSLSISVNDPKTWQQPLRAVANYDFQATSPQEISFSANQVLYLAPQQLQGSLWNSGWLMGSTDRQHAGLVPVNYIKVIRPTNGEAGNSNLESSEKEKVTEPKMEDLDKFYGDELWVGLAVLGLFCECIWWPLIWHWADVNQQKICDK